MLRLLVALTMPPTKADLLRAMVLAAKDIPCTDCGERYPSYVMEFDHVHGDKRFNLSKIVGRNSSGLSFDDVADEMAKCEVVCANCHRMRTWGVERE